MTVYSVAVYSVAVLARYSVAVLARSLRVGIIASHVLSRPRGGLRPVIERDDELFTFGYGAARSARGSGSV